MTQISSAVQFSSAKTPSNCKLFRLDLQRQHKLCMYIPKNPSIKQRLLFACVGFWICLSSSKKIETCHQESLHLGCCSPKMFSPAGLVLCKVVHTTRKHHDCCFTVTVMDEFQNYPSSTGSWTLMDKKGKTLLGFGIAGSKPVEKRMQVVPMHFSQKYFTLQLAFSRTNLNLLLGMRAASVSFFIRSCIILSAEETNFLGMIPTLTCSLTCYLHNMSAVISNIWWHFARHPEFYLSHILTSCYRNITYMISASFHVTLGWNSPRFCLKKNTSGCCAW